MPEKNNPLLKVIFLIAILFINISFSKAQWYDPEKVNKKAKIIYEAAYEFATQGDYAQSIKKLEEALKLEPKYVEVYLSRAGIYADMKNYQGSVADFKKAFSLDSIFSSTYLLPFSISLAGIGEFKQALEKVNAFLDNETLNEQSKKAGHYRKSTYEFAIDYKSKHQLGHYSFLPINVGAGINSSALEYFPSLTIDGKKMIFNRRINDDEDFYESDFENGIWKEANPVTGKINTNLNEGAETISQDGNWLIFTGCNYPEGMGSCDLYISYKTKSGNWTEAENMGDVINSESWESTPSLSPDKKDLYFSSNRTGGYGGKDIWVCHRNISGKWGKPENLGPINNTSADETCPFIHADNQTLYFNSNGHMGYGMSDLFFTKKTAENKWGEPENLGYPINTIDDEGSLVVSADGKTSYYSSDRGDVKNKLDIYTFQLRDDIAASKTLWLKGKVFDKKTKAGLPCTVELTEIDKRTTSTSIQTDEDGYFLITLPVGKDYSLNINRKGYLFYSDHFLLKNNNPDSSYSLDLPLQPIEAGAAVVLKNIFFENNQFQLKAGSDIELLQLIQLLNENNNLKVEISGHTDNIGKKEDNLSLSLNRAKSVVAFLVSKGIHENRLTAKGYGDTKPIATNDTEEGKSLNRRTEINVLSN